MRSSLPILALASFAVLPLAHATVSELSSITPAAGQDSFSLTVLQPTAADSFFSATAPQECCAPMPAETQPTLAPHDGLVWSNSAAGRTSNRLSNPRALPIPNPVNQAGTFSGYADLSTAFHAESSLTLANLAAVPEPSTLALLGSGILAAAGLLHRRRA